MANQQKIDYLDKISKDNRGSKSAGGLEGLSSFEVNPKLLIKILIGFGIFTVVLIAIGAISTMMSTTSSDTVRSRDLVDQISARAENLETTLETYQDKIRDSQLRVTILNLETFLTTMRENVNTAVERGGYGEANEAIVLSEQEYIEKVNETLEKARLNVVLEDTMRREVKKEVQLLMAMEKECIGRSDDDVLKAMLSDSYKELDGVVAEL